MKLLTLFMGFVLLELFLMFWIIPSENIGLGDVGFNSEILRMCFLRCNNYMVYEIWRQFIWLFV